jgi:hypothetical protein
MRASKITPCRNSSALRVKCVYGLVSKCQPVGVLKVFISMQVTIAPFLVSLEEVCVHVDGDVGLVAHAAGFCGNSWQLLCQTGMSTYGAAV